MRVMVIIKGTPEWEAGASPDEGTVTDMGAFNEALVKAGVMLDGEGLYPSERGARVRYSGTTRTLLDGPFAASDLVAGYWLWQVKSFDEAIEWAKRCPNPMAGESEVEIRQVLEAGDFGPELIPEPRAGETRLCAETATR